MSGSGEDDKPAAPPSTELVPSKEARALRKEIEGALQEIVPPDRREIAVERVEQIVLAESYRGPLPHPRHLAKFEEIQAGFAERIMRMTEKEQVHRHECERDIVKAESSYKPRGQYFGAGLAVFFGVCALVALYYSGPVAAGLFLTPPAFGVVVAFLRGQFSFRNTKADDDNDDDSDGAHTAQAVAVSETQSSTQAAQGP